MRLFVLILLAACARPKAPAPSDEPEAMAEDEAGVAPDAPSSQPASQPAALARTCAIPRTFGTDLNYELEPVTELAGFGRLMTLIGVHQGLFDGWLAMQSFTTPGTDAALVWKPYGGEQQKILLFTELDSIRGEGGVGVTVDPLYPSSLAPDQLRVFVSYSGGCDGETIPASYGCNRLSRFDFVIDAATGTVTRDGDEHHVMIVGDVAELHNGAAPAFGADGYLYWALGDGGAQGDGYCAGQNVATPLGKLMRIDVRGVTGDAPYAIPDTNPFANRGLSTCHRYVHIESPPDTRTRTVPCPEIIASGLRNPFTFAIDGDEVWIAEVGSNLIDSLHRYDISATELVNFGWPLWEGSDHRRQRLANYMGGWAPNFKAWQACNLVTTDPDWQPNITHPAAQFARPGSSAMLVGALVPRSSKLPFLDGNVITIEPFRGLIWAVPRPPAGAMLQLAGAKPIGSTQIFPFNVVQAPNGDVLLLGETPHRLKPATQLERSGMPALLSETGCVDPNAPTEPAPELVPYEINSPLWSDGAGKRRYFALPDGGSIDRAGNCASLDDVKCRSQAEWDLPIYSVLMKTFERGGRRLETRLLIRGGDGQWTPFTYVWKADGSDAVLTTSGAELAATATDSAWTVPRQEECLSCHTLAAGRVLGLETRQLNRSVNRGGEVTLQLDWLEKRRVFRTAVLPEDRALTLAVPWSDADSLEASARSFLHANCSHCHRAGGTAQSFMDLRVWQPFAATKLCRDGDPLSPIVPGAPATSPLLQRVSLMDPERKMPPLGVAHPSPIALDHLGDWIAGRTNCAD